MKAEPAIPTVNFHLWQPCNMRCGFCFAAFRDVRRDVLPDGHLPRQQALRIITLLAAYGFRKLTFAGGEPLLCPWLLDLATRAQHSGMVTNVVTNGSLMTTEFLQAATGLFNWVTLSVDSLDARTLTTIGRATAGHPMTADQYRRICHEIRGHGLKLKINTVVSRANRHEDLTGFILEAQPARWKILQALPVAGQNDARFPGLAVTADEFASYVVRQRRVQSAGVTVIPEDNKAMTGSYVMIDPAGRFIDNTRGKYAYSRNILHVGVHDALADIRLRPDRFLSRNGKYDW